MSIDIIDVSAANEKALALCRRIRFEVFCREQQVPESLEWDDFDAVCRHFLLRADGAPAATARARPYGQGALKIERVAVLKPWRGRGLGRAVMERVLAYARAEGYAAAVLNAQTAVRAFYADLGFVADGPEFVEAGIPHVHMTLALR